MIDAAQHLMRDVHSPPSICLARMLQGEHNENGDHCFILFVYIPSDVICLLLSLSLSVDSSCAITRNCIILAVGWVAGGRVGTGIMSS